MQGQDLLFQINDYCALLPARRLASRSNKAIKIPIIGDHHQALNQSKALICVSYLRHQT